MRSNVGHRIRRWWLNSGLAQVRGAARLIGFIAILTVSHAVCQADGPATLPSNTRENEVRDWFVKLANRNANIREGSFESLMGMRRADLPILEKVVKQSLPLKPAQAAALRRIVTQIYLSGSIYQLAPDSGFLGIQLGPAYISFAGDNDAEDSRQGAVVVVRRLPGFSGARMLRDGDVILSIVEKPRMQFSTTMEFAAIVREFSSRQTVHFQVMRQGQVISIPITLDPRPAAEGAIELNELERRRSEDADDYWDREFGPLVKEGVS